MVVIGEYIALQSQAFDQIILYSGLSVMAVAQWRQMPHF